MAIGLAALVAPAVAQGAAGASPARGEQPRSSFREAKASMRFDIPSQPLSEALSTFDDATGFYGLYAADAVAGRNAGEVRGDYRPQEALRLLLEPSGLQAYFTAPNAYVLEGAAASQAAVAASPGAADDYPRLLQAGVRKAFCRSALIAPGSYRAAFSLRVSASGQVQQPRLLDTTGNPARDAEILKTLQELRLERGPADSAEPFVMLILPETGGVSADCGAMP